MMISLIGVPVAPEFSPAAYRPVAAVYQLVEAPYRPLPVVEVGTGGFLNEAFLREAKGYTRVELVEPVQAVESAPYADLMQQVRRGFGRTMSRLPEVFGVSRQTLYNWLDGETPKEAHQERLRQLAYAAKVFEDLAFKPNAALLDRPIAKGQTFLQLLAQGEDGRAMAHKLLRVHERTQSSRGKLDALLGNRQARPEAVDLGAPSFVEEA